MVTVTKNVKKSIKKKLLKNNITKILNKIDENNYHLKYIMGIIHLYTPLLLLLYYFI